MSQPTTKELVALFESVARPYSNDSGTVYDELEQGIQAIYDSGVKAGANLTPTELAAISRKVSGLEIRHIEGETHGSVNCDDCGALFGYHRDDAPVVKVAGI